jgi:Plasmid encoded RepA protein
VGIEFLVKMQRDRDAEAKKSPIQRRLTRIKRQLKETAFEDEDRHHIHSVLALCGLPYREPAEGAREYLREYGRNSLAVQAGYLKDPETGKMVLQGLPYGPKARLLLLHICTMAIRQRSAEIAIADSMSAFIRELGFSVTGGKRGTIHQFKAQLNRLAAARMQIGLWRGDRSITLNAQPIKSFDIWLPQDPSQRMLWSSTLRLDRDFYDSLREHALPVDIGALRAFSQSAKQIDMVLWLGYRLRNVTRPYPISWGRLREQFGVNVKRLRKFREEFAKDLQLIREVFPNLPVRLAEDGI